MSVREEIARMLCGFLESVSWESTTGYGKGLCLEKADQILSHPRIAILAEDQELPWSYAHALIYIREGMDDFRTGKIDYRLYGMKVVDHVNNRVTKANFKRIEK